MNILSVFGKIYFPPFNVCAFEEGTGVLKRRRAPRVVEIQNLLFHPNKNNSDNKFAVTRPNEIPTSVKSSERWKGMSPG